MNLKIKLRLWSIIPLAIIIVILIFMFFYLQANLSAEQQRLSDGVIVEGTDAISLVLNGDRDFYQSLQALEHMLEYPVGSDEYESFKTDYLDNLEQTRTRVTDSATKQMFEGNSSLSGYSSDFNSKINNWESSSTTLISQYESLLLLQASSFAKFDEVRDKIDVLGEEISNLYESADTDETKSTLFDAMSLVLNGDRDYYQAVKGLHELLDLDVGSEEYQSNYESYTENAQQVIDRAVGAMSAITSLSSKYNSTTVSELDAAINDWQAETDTLISTYEALYANEVSNLALFNETRDTIDAIGNEVQTTVVAATQTEFTGLADAMTNIVAFVIYILIAIGVIIIASIVYGIYFSGSIANNLNNSMKELTESSNQVASAAGQIASTSQSLSSASQQQASSVEEMSGIIETNSEMTRSNTQSTIQANELTSTTQVLVDEGTQQMTEMNRAMSSIQASSDEISKIMKVIDEIAFQTNILALNAAVEAARAGEAGAGFAVVADEVKNLATRSQEAAQNSAQIVEDNIKLAKEGVDSSAKVGEALNKISEQVDKVNSLMNEVSKASKAQQDGMDQLTSTVSQVESITQENAAGAEETAASGEELSAQSDVMISAISKVNTIVLGKTNNLSNTVVSPSKTQAIGQTVNRKPMSKSIKIDEVLPLEDEMSDF